MLDHKRERITPEDIGFIDPDKVHEVNILERPEEVKETLLRTTGHTTTGQSSGNTMLCYYMPQKVLLGHVVTHF